MITFNCVYFIFFCVTTHCIVAEHDPVLFDGGTAPISLLNFNVSDPDGESIEFTYTLLSDTSAVVLVSNIPGDAYFLVVQAHSYLRNVTLSYDKKANRTNSVLGTNVGLWKSVTTSSVAFYLQYQGDVDNTTVMLAVQAYGNQAPTPGGCNMEFPTEVAPYLATTYTPDLIQVNFAPAAPPMSVLTWLNLQERSCVVKYPPIVDHIVYRLYLPERDFSPDMYFVALQNVMTVGRIKQWAREVPDKASAGGHALRRVFASYPGTGSAFVVVAHSLTSSAVYVPSFTYGCDARVEENTCPALTTVFSNILSATILFLGIFACLAAHRFFKIELILLGFLAGGLILYTGISNLQPEAEALVPSVLGGLAIGVACLLLWCCYAAPFFPVVLAGSLLGYIIAAIMFTFFVDWFDSFTSDANYWISFGCITLFLPALLLPLSEKVSIISTAVLGAYAFIIPIDYYIGSNLRFILINSIRRATNPLFKWAVIDLPCQANDMVLIVTWISVIIVGITLQVYLTKNKPPFPPPPQLRRWYVRLRGPTTPTERTPLIRT